MKRKPNSPTRSKSARHNGRADNDTDTAARYAVTLCFTQQSRITVIVKANSASEAKTKVEKIWRRLSAMTLSANRGQADALVVSYDDVAAESTETVNGGQDND